MNNTEIERKFLVQGDFRPFVRESVPMEQGYLCPISGRTVRVRRAGDRGWITVKGPAPEGSIARFEWEKEIGAADAEQLLALCGSERIVKTRHLVPAGDGAHTWEVDEFHGLNEGLVVAEIELRSEDDPFPRPAWLGREVTGERRYHNSVLLRCPYKDWEDKDKQI